MKYPKRSYQVIWSLTHFFWFQLLDSSFCYDFYSISMSLFISVDMDPRVSLKEFLQKLSRISPRVNNQTKAN